MVLPSRLAEPALAILRQLARSTPRRAGNSLALDSIERTWKLPPRDLEVGLADLEIAGLVRTVRDESPRAVLTAQAEAYFARYYWECR